MIKLGVTDDATSIYNNATGNDAHRHSDNAWGTSAIQIDGGGGSDEMDLLPQISIVMPVENSPCAIPIPIDPRRRSETSGTAREHSKRSPVQGCIHCRVQKQG